MSFCLPEDQRQLYQQEGYMILPEVIPRDLLELLREECSYFLGYFDSIMDAKGVEVDNLCHRGKRYFINNRYRLSSRLQQFLFGPLMAEVAQAALGPDVYLFHEQWVVKGAEQGMKFGWHQDSGYVQHYDSTARHKPYVTVWCTLDDVSEENGTVYLLPHSRGGHQGHPVGSSARRRHERRHRLRRRRSGRSDDRSRRERRCLYQLQPAPKRAEPNEPLATNLFTPIQQRTDLPSRRQTVGDGRPLYQGRSGRVRSIGGRSRTIWTIS